MPPAGEKRNCSNHAFLESSRPVYHGFFQTGRNQTLWNRLNLSLSRSTLKSHFRNLIHRKKGAYQNLCPPDPFLAFRIIRTYSAVFMRTT